MIVVVIIGLFVIVLIFVMVGSDGICMYVDSMIVLVFWYGSVFMMLGRCVGLWWLMLRLLGIFSVWYVSMLKFLLWM